MTHLKLNLCHLLPTGIAYCIHEYLPFGSLRAFLETEFGHNNMYNNTLEPIPREFVSFALDVVRGMEFLRYHGVIFNVASGFALTMSVIILKF